MEKLDSTEPDAIRFLNGPNSRKLKALSKYQSTLTDTFLERKS